MNYDADRQRQSFRQTQGKMLIWGKEPVFIKATYTAKVPKKKSDLIIQGTYINKGGHREGMADRNHESR
jgi:hypothetical protein